VSVDLNHLVIPARDKDASAVFLAQMLGLPGPISFGPFMAVQVGNGVTLVYVDADGDITPLHYAFLVAETTFDEIFCRIREWSFALLRPWRHRPLSSRCRRGAV
jgi:hypothetical protein